MRKKRKMSSARPTRIRSSLALATPCLLAFVIAAVGIWCSNCGPSRGTQAPPPFEYSNGVEGQACPAGAGAAAANVAQRHAAVLLHPCVSRVGPHAAHHRPPPSNMSYAKVADRLTEALRAHHLVLLLNLRDGLAHRPHCGVALAQAAAAGGTLVARERARRSASAPGRCWSRKMGWSPRRAGLQ